MRLRILMMLYATIVTVFIVIGYKTVNNLTELVTFMGQSGAVFAALTAVIVSLWFEFSNADNKERDIKRKTHNSISALENELFKISKDSHSLFRRAKLYMDDNMPEKELNFEAMCEEIKVIGHYRPVFNAIQNQLHQFSEDILSVMWDNEPYFTTVLESSGRANDKTLDQEIIIDIFCAASTLRDLTCTYVSDLRNIEKPDSTSQQDVIDEVEKPDPL